MHARFGVVVPAVTATLHSPLRTAAVPCGPTMVETHSKRLSPLSEDNTKLGRLESVLLPCMQHVKHILLKPWDQQSSCMAGLGRSPPVPSAGGGNEAFSLSGWPLLKGSETSRTYRYRYRIPGCALPNSNRTPCSSQQSGCDQPNIMVLYAIPNEFMGVRGFQTSAQIHPPQSSHFLPHDMRHRTVTSYRSSLSRSPPLS